jgi:aryl-alcohol dehydrogenase-like predicted oxidoreductase
METRRLGADGPEISVIGFGSWEAGGQMWGSNDSDRQVVEAIHAGLGAGMTWVDTAEVYGQGTSERLVGEALRGRDDVLVFTKVAPDDEGTGIRPEEIRPAIDGSLRRLGRDHVDLYQIHWPDDRVPLEETWGVMAELVADGKARWIGVSNFERERIERCLAIHPVASVQNEFSLLTQDDRRELLPWLDERGIGYLAYSPLAAGRLTGAMSPDAVFGDDDWRSGRGEYESWREERAEWPFDPESLRRDLARVDAMRPIAQRLDIGLAQLALRGALEQRGVTAVIAGSRNADHTRANAAAGSVRLDPDTRADLAALFRPAS